MKCIHLRGCETLLLCGVGICCLFVLTPRPTHADPQKDRHSGITMEVDLPLTHGTYIPAQFHFKNGGAGRRLDIRLRQNYGLGTIGMAGGSLRVAMSLPPGSTQVELPLINTLSGGEFNATVWVDGRPAPDLSVSEWMPSHSWQEGMIVALGDGLQKFIDQVSNNGVSGLTVAVPNAPRHWQGYLGGQTIVMMSRTIPLLDGAQKQALERWVTFGGGTLWLVTEGDDSRHLELGLVPGSAKVLPDISETNRRRSSLGDDPLAPFSEDITWHRAFAGSILRSELTALEGLGAGHMQLLKEEAPRTARLFAIDDGYEYGFREDVFHELSNIPRGGYAILSIFLALLIGPVNLIILRKRRRQVLFYITAPALALVGMLALTAYTFAGEGFGLKTNETALLLHDLNRNEGALYRARGFYGPFAPTKGITLSTDTAAVPFFRNDERQMSPVETDWTSAQVLKDGWIRSREASGLLTVAPGRVRVGLRPVVHGPGDVGIVNELKGPARDVWVKLDNTIYYTREAPPGREVALEPADSFFNEGAYFFVDTDELDWKVLARTEWLPGLENGAINGETLRQDFYYIGLDVPVARKSEPAHE